MNFYSNLVLIFVVFLVAATLIICEPTKKSTKNASAEVCEINQK